MSNIVFVRRLSVKLYRLEKVTAFAGTVLQHRFSALGFFILKH